jgi:hypothetical protein
MTSRFRFRLHLKSAGNGCGISNGLLRSFSGVPNSLSALQGNQMTRVMVIGNAGGGKSTMCKALSRAHSLPYSAVDRIQWWPNWVRVPDDELRANHDAILSQDRWLIDGYGPWFSVLDRLEACDTVVFIDHPFRVHLWWATKRQFKSMFWGRPDGPDGCPMFPVTIRLFKMMWWLHTEMRPRLIRAIYERSDRIRVIHIKSPKELATFTANPV